MTKDLQNHTLTAISFLDLMRTVAAYGVSPAYLPRLASLMFSSGVSFPLRLVDTARSRGAVKRARIEQAPLFVVGHPRSGTTHLHNLFCRDPRFGCATTLHCAATRMFLGMPQVLRLLMQGMLPEKRPMDDVKVGLDEPQEEEMAMARISPLSFNHGLHFPLSMRDVFHRSVTFESESSRDEQLWKQRYHWFLRRVHLDQQRKPLCLKSPPNMARIPQLLELFPDARFVHIYRNPFEVYVSVLRLWTKVLPMLCLQTYSEQAVEENLVYFFQRMVRKFYDDRSSIPDGQVAEVQFEKLEADPLGELERVYGELRIEGFGHVLPEMERYVESLSGYRKNTYSFDRETVERVRDVWGFAADRWGYADPECAPQTR